MALNGHQFLECYHAAFLGAGVINPLNLRLAPKELEYILADSGTKVCFTDQFFAPVIDKVRAAVGHRARRDDRRRRRAARRRATKICSRARRPRFPTSPRKTIPSCSCTRAAPPGLPKGVLLDHRAEMLNLYHVMQVWRFDAERRVPAPDADVPRRVDGRDARRSRAGRRVGVRAAVRSGARARAVRAVLGHADRDGADDDRHVVEPSRLPARAARVAAHAHVRRVADAGRAARPAARAVPRPRHLPGLRHDRVVGGAHRARSRRAPRRRRAAALGRAAAAGRRAVDPGPDGEPLPPGRDRRGVRPGRQLHDASTGTSPRRPPTRSAAAGTTPATPATSTPTATCSSSTG